MNYMVTEIYDALVSADADEEKARAAAERMASFEHGTDDQFALLREDNEKLRTEMAELRGELTAKFVSLEGNLNASQSSLEGKLNASQSSLEGKLNASQSSLEGKLNAGQSSLEGKLNAGQSSLEGKLNASHSNLRGEMTLIKWMFGVIVATNIAILFRLFTS